MDLNHLSRVEVIKVSSLHRNSMKLFPLGKTTRQKIIVGDNDGVLTCFGIKKGSINNVFKTAPDKKPVTSIEMHKDKAYVSQGQTVKGIKKKGGKEFYRLESGLTEDICCMHAELPDFWLSGEYALHHFRESTKIGTFMAPDRINAITSQSNTVSSSYDCLIGCQDHRVLVIKDLTAQCEVVVDSPVTALARYPRRLDSSNTIKGFMYGTEKGSAACITIKSSSITKNWQLPKGRHPITILNSADFTHDGVEDLLVGRDNGSIEIWSFDISDEKPSIVFERNINESITGIESGHLFTQENEDLVVSTYSGKIIGYCSDQASAFQAVQERDDLAVMSKLKAKLSSTTSVDSTKVYGISNEHRISGLRKEIETLEEKLQQSKVKYSKMSEDMFAVYCRYNVQHKLILDSDNECFRLSVEIDINIDTIGIMSSVAIDLIDTDTPSVIISNTRLDQQTGSQQLGPTKCLATFRCTDLTKRLEILIRTAEGQYGNLEAFIIPRLTPRISKVVIFFIKPLSMHERIHEIPLGLDRPMNSLTISGSFSQTEMHTWVGRCLEGIPDKIYDNEECTYYFRSTFQNTYLICHIKKGESSFETDNVSTLSILEEVITKEATDRKTRVKVSFEINVQSYASTLSLLWPKIEYQINMTKKVQLIEALREIQMHEENVDFLTPVYQDIIKNYDVLQKQFKLQPRRISFLFDIVLRLYSDKFKFKRQNAQAKIDSLRKLLSGEKFDLDSLINLFKEE